MGNSKPKTSNGTKVATGRAEQRFARASWRMLARDGACTRLEALTVERSGGQDGRKALAVFRFVEEAELYLRLGEHGDPGEPGGLARGNLWRAWVFGRHGEYCTPEPGVRFYNPRHYCAHKAIVIGLREEACERLVVEVEDPDGVVERVNRAVGASARAASMA